MKGLICSLLMICLVTSVFARGYSGGARGGGFRSYSGGSYSSRSYSSSRPQYAPRAIYRSSPTVIHNNTTVVHSSSGYGSGGGFFSGMFGGMLGASLMNHSQPVVVQQPVVQAQPAQVVDEGQQVMTQPSNSSTFWTFIFILIALFVFVPLIVYLVRREAN